MGKHRVLFLPDNRTVEVERGTTLFRAAAAAGIELKTTCGGDGTCGRCAVNIVEGRSRAAVSEGNLSPRARKAGLVLACRTRVEGDLVVEIPPEARLAEHQVLLERIEKREILAEQDIDLLGRYGLAPFSRRVTVRLDEATLTENASDHTRLMLRLNRVTANPDLHMSLSALRTLPAALRAAGWEVTATLADANSATEIISVEPGRPRSPLYGAAIDIGTTTVVVHLVDLETGATVDRLGTHNRQAAFGDDVINRIIHATSEPGGLDALQKAVVTTINDLLKGLYARNEVVPADVRAVMAAGNTTMTHLFLGIDPTYIRLEPYIPAATSFPPARAGALGLLAHPEATVMTFPAVASYVGGDIVAGVLATDIAHSPELSLFIDIGTNGEIALGNQDWLVACACSAGPCFEGGGIMFGTRAMPGAIQRLDIDPATYEVEVRTIGEARPVGICGSGLVDALAKLRHAGIIDRAGKFQPVPSPRFRAGLDGPEFVLVWAAEAEPETDIVITESDVKNLIRAKGAIYAGIRSLLQTVQLPLEAIDRVYIAGGFGNYLNIHDAVQIGMLPDVPRERYRFVGNTSAKGARLALLSRSAWAEAAELARKMTYLELSVGNLFMEEFVSAMFLPHTDLGQFPSVVR